MVFRYDKKCGYGLVEYTGTAYFVIFLFILSESMSKLGQLLKRLGIRAPWQITGPASSPEYLSHLPRATEYRAVSPGYVHSS
jgi:hypothetical protein